MCWDVKIDIQNIKKLSENCEDNKQQKIISD